MKLDGLAPLYKHLKSDNVTYGVFDFRKNNVDFDVFFDIGEVPFKLGFIVLRSNYSLWIDVKVGFEINTFLSIENLNALRNVLNLNNNSTNPFSTNVFFEEFNSKIPERFKQLNKEIITQIVSTAKEIEEADKIYYLGQTDWTDRDTGNRSQSNLEKTRYLYPELYERTKNRNISIKYTANRNDSNENEL